MDVRDIFTVLVAALDSIERTQGAPETRLRALLFSAAADIAPQFTGSITRRVVQVEDDYQANDPIFLVGADAAVQVVEVPQSALADTSGLFDFWEPPEESAEVAPPGSLEGGHTRDEFVHVQGDTHGGDVQLWAQPLTERVLRSVTGADFGSVELRAALTNEVMGEPWPSEGEASEAQSGGFAVSGTASGRITSSEARWRVRRHAELAWIEGRGPVPYHIDPWDYRVNYVGPLARKIDDYRQENAPIRERARRRPGKGKQVPDVPPAKKVPGRWDF